MGTFLLRADAEALAEVRSVMDATSAPAGGRSALHQFAIPHTFGPTLTVKQAAVAALLTFARIFLGCVLFAVWGSYTALAIASIHNHWLRAIAVVPLIGLFLTLFALLMAAISAFAKWARMG